MSLSVKELVSNALETPEGAVCAIGALARHKAIDVQQRAAWIAEAVDEEDDAEAQNVMEGVAQDCGIPPMVAWKIIETNDDPGAHTIHPKTPAARYTRVLAWVQSQIKQEAIPA